MALLACLAEPLVFEAQASDVAHGQSSIHRSRVDPMCRELSGIVANVQTKVGKPARLDTALVQVTLRSPVEGNVTVNLGKLANVATQYPGLQVGSYVKVHCLPCLEVLSIATESDNAHVHAARRRIGRHASGTVAAGG